MKRAFLLLFLVSLWASAVSYAAERKIPGAPPSQSSCSWKLVHPPQPTGHFWALAFADKNNGWAVGDSGTILHTSDGGNSWSVRASGTATNLRCVSFVDAFNGWIGAGDNTIGRTTDGGLSWTWQQPPGESRRTFMSVSFVNDQMGWIADNFSGILHTEDGGVTWTPQQSGTRWAVTSIYFLDINEGWAVATNRIVLHTTDGGAKWATTVLDTVRCPPTTTLLFNDIYFADRSHGWIATTDLSGSLFYPLASIIGTSDSGATWICWQTPVHFLISAVQFVDNEEGCAASEEGIIHSTDGGGSWSLDCAAPIVVDVAFTDRLHGWALTFAGAIYRYGSESAAMQITPPADTIFIGGGSTPPLLCWHQPDTSLSVDSLIIRPGYNTMIWTGDSISPRTYWNQIAIVIPDSAHELTYTLSSADRQAMPLPFWDAFMQDSLTQFSSSRSLRIIALRNGVPADTATCILISLVGLSVPDENSHPSSFSLAQNYPNPFNPSTTIRFSVPVRSHVRLTILDLLGREVAELANEEMEAGSFERMWRQSAASGMYFYRLEATTTGRDGRQYVDIRRMLLLK